MAGGGTGCRRPRGKNKMSNCYFPLTSGMVGNFSQLHQLQELVEHLLRSSRRRSGIELVEMFGYSFMESSQICWSRVLSNTPWESSAPPKIAPLHEKIAKQFSQLHSTPRKTSSTPGFSWNYSRGAPPNSGAGGDGDNYPPATDYTPPIPFHTHTQKRKVNSAPASSR